MVAHEAGGDWYDCACAAEEFDVFEQADGDGGGAGREFLFGAGLVVKGGGGREAGGADGGGEGTAEGES